MWTNIRNSTITTCFRQGGLDCTVVTDTSKHLRGLKQQRYLSCPCFIPNMARKCSAICHPHSTAVVFWCHLPTWGSRVPSCTRRKHENHTLAPVGTHVTFPHIVPAKASHMVTSNVQRVSSAPCAQKAESWKYWWALVMPTTRPKPTVSCQVFLFPLGYIVVALQSLKI